MGRDLLIERVSGRSRTTWEARPERKPLRVKVIDRGIGAG
jgi:hypothetical protein